MALRGGNAMNKGTARKSAKFVKPKKTKKSINPNIVTKMKTSSRKSAANKVSSTKAAGGTPVTSRSKGAKKAVSKMKGSKGGLNRKKYNKSRGK